MKIPVFHDDQHGTAIIVGAAVVNALRVVGKDIGKARRRRLQGQVPRRSLASTWLVALGVNAGERYRHRHQGVSSTKGRVEEMDRQQRPGYADTEAPHSWAR